MTTIRTRRLPSVLSIAGSDPGGGAGIQADLKTFAAFRLHGLSVITAITAQNMRQVSAVHNVPARVVEQQLQALFADFDIRAVKIGMLGSAANVVAVAEFLRSSGVRNVVLDPVLASSSGARLLSTRGVSALRETLIPLTNVFTPNLPEAEALLGRRVRSADDARRAAQDLRRLGARAVLLKGGHGHGAMLCDYLADARGIHEFRHARLPIQAHGTGCVLSAAIAAGLALGHARLAAIRVAQDYLQHALHASYRPGKGPIRALNHAAFCQ